MTSFEILIQNGRTKSSADPRRISMRLGDECLTRLIRRGSHEPDDWLEAPPWWRIRWEPAPHTDLNAEWRLAHHLSSAGAGYHWPNVSIWGEGSRVGIAVHADANNLKPSLKFIAQPRLSYVPSSTVEDAIDRFVGHVLEHVGEASDGLDTECRQLQSERADPAVATWRKLEAMLGFDPDDAPEGLVDSLEALTERYGLEPLQEVALAHQGERATEALNDCIEAAKSSNVLIRTPIDFTRKDRIEVGRSSLEPPRRFAVRVANQLRHWLVVPPGPIGNKRLSEIVGTNIDCIRTDRRSTFDIPYPLRLRQETASKLALRSTWSHTRRFELCRSLGDIIWSCNDAMGPLSAAKSERQKFQRAFAQGLLCPFADLQAYINTDKPDEDDIHAAARHFDVSERLIETTLVNNQVIDQASFEQMVDAS
ncbi:MAG: hypothetical protein OXH52_18885 [Gammaproteobacteria bacterium]|nr:hypothetical protein [Gammaproteobacteria bacterium]